MSIRHEFSYWLTIAALTSNELDKADAWLRHHGVVPDMLAEVEREGLECTYSVDQKLGTIEIWSDADTVIGDLAEAMPALEISLVAQDEEDHAIADAYYWHNGVSASTNYNCDELDVFGLLKLQAEDPNRHMIEMARRAMVRLRTKVDDQTEMGRKVLKIIAEALRKIERLDTKGTNQGRLRGIQHKPGKGMK